MKTAFDVLVGLTLLRVERIHDYIQFHFDNGGVLNIFNEFTISGFISGNLSEAVGSRVLSVRHSETAVELDICGKMVRIGLSGNDYNGPEVLEYTDENGNIIVWR